MTPYYSFKTRESFAIAMLCLLFSETLCAKQRATDFSMGEDMNSHQSDLSSKSQRKSGQIQKSVRSHNFEKTANSQSKSEKNQNQTSHIPVKGINTFQGQATSSAFNNDYTIVPIDITFGADKSLTPTNDGGAPQGKNLPVARHATPSGQTIKAVTKETLNKAIAADALKRKLKEEQRKKMLLEEFAKQKKSTEKNMVLDLISTTHSEKK